MFYCKLLICSNDVIVNLVHLPEMSNQIPLLVELGRAARHFAEERLLLGVRPLVAVVFVQALEQFQAVDTLLDCASTFLF